MDENNNSGLGIDTPFGHIPMERLRIEIPDEPTPKKPEDDREIPIGTAHDSANESKPDRKIDPSKIVVGDKLSKEDVRSLVGATEVTFLFNAEGSEMRVDRVKVDPTYGVVNFGREITTSSAPIRTNGDTPTSCRLKIQGDDQAWQTIANSLREGDVTELEWHSDTQSQDLKDAGFVRDALFFNVTRYDGRGRGAVRHFCYFVSDRIVKADSDERICSFNA